MDTWMVTAVGHWITFTRSERALIFNTKIETILMDNVAFGLHSQLQSACLSSIQENANDAGG